MLQKAYLRFGLHLPGAPERGFCICTAWIPRTLGKAGMGRPVIRHSRNRECTDKAIWHGAGGRRDGCGHRSIATTVRYLHAQPETGSASLLDLGWSPSASARSGRADPSARCRDVNLSTRHPSNVARLNLSWSAANPAPRVCLPPPGTHAPPSTSTASIREGHAKSNRQRRPRCLANGYSVMGSSNRDARIRMRKRNSSGDGGRGVVDCGRGRERGRGGATADPVVSMTVTVRPLSTRGVGVGHPIGAIPAGSGAQRPPSRIMGRGSDRRVRRGGVPWDAGECGRDAPGDAAGDRRREKTAYLTSRSPVRSGH